MRNSTLARTRSLKLPPIFDALIRQALSHRTVENTYDQPAHGLAIAEWVYFDGADWLLADRDSGSTFADGVVSHVEGDQFDVLTHGVFTDASGLTPPNTQYLSSTPGTLTDTLPSSDKVQTLGRALSATSMLVQISSGNAPAITPERVDIYVNNTSIAPAFTIEQDGTGDATMRLLLTGGQAYTIGIDNNDSDKLKISTNSGGVGTSDRLTLTTSGDFGINTTGPDRKLDVLDASNAQIRITHTDGSVYVEFQADSSGDLTITPTGSNIIIPDAKDFQLNATTGTKIGTATTQKLSLWNATPIVQPPALTTQLTSITHTAPGTPDYALQDLVDSSGGSAFGFADKDEGNTLLSVVANLQTRVAELETKLQALGAIA